MTKDQISSVKFTKCERVLLKALQFYANTKTYQNGGWEGHRDDIYYDNGKVAREAIDKFRRKP